MQIPQTISFVIRTYNEAAFLGTLLDTLDSQTNCPAVREVVVVDSGSTDRTVEIAKTRKTVLIQIPKEEFDYSKTLNAGIKASRGDLIVIISAHAIPCGNDWLELIVSHFGDNKVAGVFCQQVPWPDAHWREVRRLERTFGTETTSYASDGSALSDIPFSNAASCIRRTVWEKHAFVLPAAEDREWAAWAVSSGYTIVYDAEASVFHSHNESPRQSASRAILLEKSADLRNKRKRTGFLTLRQGLGHAYRDTKAIVHLENTKLNRAKLVWEALLRSFWFVRDFYS